MGARGGRVSLVTRAAAGTPRSVRRTVEAAGIEMASTLVKSATSKKDECLKGAS